MPNLSVCCVTKMDECVQPFLLKLSDWCKNTNTELVLGIDSSDIFVEKAFTLTDKVFQTKSLGYIESVLDSIISKCTGDYIFRIDDDETMSDSLSKWLEERSFSSDLYSFPRYNLWNDENHFLPGIYPDTQIRLATKQKSFGRNVIHNISPHGYGTKINKQINHHKFLIKSYEERKKIAEIYESIKKGAGLGDYLIFNLPEDYYKKKGVAIFHEQIKDR